MIQLAVLCSVVIIFSSCSKMHSFVFILGYLERAKLCYESYLEICELLEDRRSISKANHNLGDLHLTLGRLKLQRDGKLENSPEGRDHLSIAAMYFEKHLEYILDHGSRYD